MKPKKVTPSYRKLDRLHYGFEWPKATNPFQKEILPILQALSDTDLNQNLRRSLSNYLVVRLVSVMEYYFSNAIRRLVDERKLDISELIDAKTADEARKHGFTDGEIMSMAFYFGNYKEVNTAFSSLLGFDYFAAV